METHMKNVICSIAAGILIGAGAFAVSADQAAVAAPEGSAPVLERRLVRPQRLKRFQRSSS